MKPTIIKGSHHSDERGSLFFNNDFETTAVKRMYFISNINTDIVRAWMGHRVEQRWFLAVQGSFKIQLIAVDNWEMPSKTQKIITFALDAQNMDVLHIPAGYVTSIQALESQSKLMVMANYFLNELDDFYRFDVDYFDKIN